MLIDLYADGVQGEWLVALCEPPYIASVVSHDERVLQIALARGMRTRQADSRNMADIALSIHYRQILTESQLRCYKHPLNLHPGFLPWNRGYYPVFWSIVDGTPAGVTLHRMSAVVDAGPVIERRLVEAYEWDTGESLLRRVYTCEQKLIIDWLPRIIAGDIPIGSLGSEKGTYHARMDFVEFSHSLRAENLSAAQLIRYLRAFTHSDFEMPAVRLSNIELHLKIQRLAEIHPPPT